jgi:hypothetical protein
MTEDKRVYYVEEVKVTFNRQNDMEYHVLAMKLTTQEATRKADLQKKMDAAINTLDSELPMPLDRKKMPKWSDSYLKERQKRVGAIHTEWDTITGPEIQFTVPGEPITAGQILNKLPNNARDINEHTILKKEGNNRHLFTSQTQ